VAGVEAAGQGTTERKLKFLRRIPIDPMTGEANWGMRSYEDRPDSKSWGGGTVYDVYSRSEGTGLDGTKYQDW
jgi:general secretion pathway protein G